MVAAGAVTAAARPAVGQLCGLPLTRRSALCDVAGSAAAAWGRLDGLPQGRRGARVRPGRAADPEPRRPRV